MLNIIANAEYSDLKTPETRSFLQDHARKEIKKAKAAYENLGQDVEVVEIQDPHNGNKYHLFAFGENLDKPLYRQEGRWELSEKQIASGIDYQLCNYSVHADWQEYTGYTEYQAQAKAAIEKYRKTQEVKAAKAEPVEQVQFWANQAWRDGIVLAAIEDRALIAYRMPAGAVFMVIVAHDPDTGAAQRQWGEGSSYVKGYRYGSYQSISANALKKNAKWLAEVVKVEGFEDGNVDQGLGYVGEDLE